MSLLDKNKIKVINQRETKTNEKKKKILNE